MATALKKSFVHKILSLLSEERLTKLNNLMNGQGLEKKTINLKPFLANSLSDEDKGVNYVTMILDENNNILIDGLLCYIDDENCGLFAISGTQEEMRSISIDPINHTYKYLYEGLDTEEMRREIGDLLGGGGGGGEPANYLKTIAKDTSTSTITIKDQDDTETTFTYGGESNEYKIYQFYDTPDHQTDFITISGVKVPKLGYNAAYEIWENAVYNKKFNSALKIVKTTSPTATTDGDFWTLNNVAMSSEEAVNILYFSLKDVGIISYTLDRNGSGQAVTSINFKKFGEGGTGGGQEFVNTLPIPTEADEGVIYTLYQQGRIFPSDNWPFTDFDHYYKVNPLLSGSIDVTIEYIEEHGSYKLTLDITGVGAQTLEIPCIYFTINSVNELLSTLPEPLPVSLFIDCDDDDPDRVIYGTQLFGESDATKWPLFMADGPFDSTNIPTTYVKVGEGETYTTDVENNIISIGGIDYVLSEIKFDLVDFFQIAGQPDALLRCTTATDPDRVIVITGSKKVVEENTFIPLQVIYDPNYTAISGSYALNGDQLLEITQEIKQELSNVKNKDSSNAISCKAVYDYVAFATANVQFPIVNIDQTTTVDGVVVPKMINRTVIEISDEITQLRLKGIYINIAGDVNVALGLYGANNAGERTLVINYKGYDVKYTTSSDQEADDATIEIIGGITTTKLATVLEGSSDIVIDLNTTDSKLQARLDQDIKDFILPVEVPLAKVQHEIIGSDSKIIVLADVLDPENHYEITFEVESTDVHFGANFVVFPENEAPCFTEGMVDVGGEHKTFIATMDDTGQVTITLLGVELDPSSEDTRVYYRRHI